MLADTEIGPVRRKRRMRPSAVTALAAILMLGGAAACSGDSAAPTPSPVAPTPPPPAPPPPPPPSSSSVSISGQVTYQAVGINTTNNQLNLGNLTTRPARGVIVQAVNAGGSVIASTTTDALGNYVVTVPLNTNVRIQALARLQQTGTGATWDIAARDNTSSNAQYVLTGAMASSGDTNQTRNLNAPSGSDGSAYTGPRTAAPFAIIDEIFGGLQVFTAADPNVDFPFLQVFWSPQNRPVNGTIADGEIGSSAYQRISGVPTVRILGDTATDTDEFDEHVVTHEFGHYFEDQLSRSDSVGGSHSLSSRLDPRVAFGEGWGNALSGIMTGDPVYRDSGFQGGRNGFAFSVERNDVGMITGSNGWYGESSVQSILYDIFDSASDGPDTISAGFAPIYNTFRSTAYIQTDAPTSIYSFTANLRNQPGINSLALDALLAFQNINGTGLFGDGETNNGGDPNFLPVVKTVTIGGGPLRICTSDDQGLANRIGNRVLIRLNVPSAQTLTLRMARVSGDTNRDPDFDVYRRGNIFARAFALPAEQEVLAPRNFPAGVYIIDAIDFMNLDIEDADPPLVPGDACFDFTVQ